MNLSNKICESRRVNNEYQNYLGRSILLQCHVIKILRTEHYSLITINFLRTNFFYLFFMQIRCFVPSIMAESYCPHIRSGMPLHFAVYLDRSPAFVTFWWYHYNVRFSHGFSRTNLRFSRDIIRNLCKVYLERFETHLENLTFSWYNDIIRT